MPPSRTEYFLHIGPGLVQDLSAADPGRRQRFGGAVRSEDLGLVVEVSSEPFE